MKRGTFWFAVCALSVTSMRLSAQDMTADVYRNPVIDYSLPDPSVVRGDDGFFYLYATEDIRNLPIHRSKKRAESGRPT